MSGHCIVAYRPRSGPFVESYVASLGADAAQNLQARQRASDLVTAALVVLRQHLGDEVRVLVAHESQTGGAVNLHVDIPVVSALTPEGIQRILVQGGARPLPGLGLVSVISGRVPPEPPPKKAS